MRKLVFIISLYITTFSLFSQNITGKVIDSENGEPLIGCNVVLGLNNGTTTDINGDFTLKGNKGDFTIKVSYIGYQKYETNISINDKDIDLNIALNRGEDLDIVVISGSKFSKPIEEETVSIDVISNKLIENYNPTDASQIVNKTPGVTIADGQVNIRNGSGYSYGAGSRVQLLVDDMPLMAADLGDIRWKFLPIENTEQIEIIKGAASVLYGSSALNGVIHLRTGYAKNKPETKFQVYQTIYSNPKKDSLIWWEKETYRPNATGMNFVHKQKFGQFDFVAGGNLALLNSYLKEGNEYRGRFNFKTRYRDKKIDGLSYGVNGNFMYEQFGRFFVWKDYNTEPYVPMDGTISKDRYWSTSVDPFVTYINNKKNKHSLRTRYYTITRFRNNINDNTDQFYAEYQYQHNVKDNLVITSGINGSYSDAVSNLFKVPGDSTRKLSDSHSIYNSGIYSQADYKYKNLSISGGIRMELNGYDDKGNIEFTNPLFRLGLNQKVGKATFFRGSFGQGYRYSSLSELFLDDNLSLLNIFPNPNLGAEKGYTVELGIKQGIMVGKWKGFLDLATFWMEYDDMIEFTIGEYDEGVGFKSINIGETRIGGFEASIIGQGKIGPIEINSFTGYTYSYGADLTGDSTQKNVGVFFNELFGTFANGVDSLQSPKILKYRNRHVGRGDIELGYKKLKVGVSANFLSPFERVDPVFLFFIQGLEDYANTVGDGDLVWDLRASYDINDRSKIGFLVKNVGNIEYSNRPGVLEAPRNFTIQYTFKM